MLLVGIAMLGFTASSVSAVTPWACCQITDGYNVNGPNCASGNGCTASCYLGTVCGQYDGYAWGQEGDGSYWGTLHFQCTADCMAVQATSYDTTHSWWVGCC